MTTGPDTRAQELLEKGASLYEEGKLYEALSCWKQVLQLDPDNEIAAEYLRFIEDNFQIGVDAFIEHHNPQPSAPPAQPTPPPRTGPAMPPPPPPEESLEELDWSEILETDGSEVPERSAAVPEVSTNEDFFADLQPGSLAPSPGREAEAWGAPGSAELASAQLGPGESAERMPEVDPLDLPAAHFAAPYQPPSNAEHGSISQEILPGDPRSRRRTGGLPPPRSGPPPPPRAALATPAPTPAPVESRDIADMSEESIEMLLDQDFRAWEDGGGAPLAPEVPVELPSDDADLEAMLSAGLGEDAEVADLPPPPSPRTPASAASSPPPAAAAPKAPLRGAKITGRSSAPAAPVGPAPPDVEALLRAGLADLDAIESTGASPAASTPPRQLIKAPPPGTDLDGLMREARRKQQAGDFSGSLELVEQVLAGDPNHVEARRYLEENTTRLLAMYRSRLGNMQRQPRVKLRPQEVMWQSLDHRAGFLLSQVDGMTSYEDIIEISGMPVLEATRILARLVEHGVVG